MRRFAVLSGLYFAQGLPYGFFSHAVPVLLNRTHPPEIVGLSSLLAIPWAFKFLWAPLFDRAAGSGVAKRTRLLWPLQLSTVGSLALLGLMPASDDRLAPLMVGFFVVSVLAATQDVATDALAIDILAPKERARGGAIQTGAYRVGMIAGGGGVLALIDRLGFREAFLGMAALVLLSAAPLVGMRDRHAAPDSPVRDPEAAPRAVASERALGLLASFFRRPEARSIVGLLFFYKLGDALCAGMVTRWFVKQGMSTTDIALSRGLVGGMAAVAGAAIGAIGLASLGRRRGLVLFASVQTVAIGMYLVLALMTSPQAPAPELPLWVYHAASLFEHLAGGAATAAIFTYMMDLTRPDARATDYTAQACVLVAVTGLGLVLSGFVVKLLGLVGLFAVATAAGCLAPFAASRTVRQTGIIPSLD